MTDKSRPPPIPSDADIQATLRWRVDLCRLCPGYAVGITERGDRRLVVHGYRDGAATAELDRDALFVIGSVTKLFTALLLADMVQRGEVSLSDPVSDFLPAGVRVPAYDGRPITLADLASHTSGLPRRPSNLPSHDPANRYAGYSAELLYDFLSSYVLPGPIGEQVVYSNVGFGLLGHALELRAGMDYETLLRTRICTPLGLADTAISLPPGRAERLAAGHDESLDPVPDWDTGVLAAAGALRSSVPDLLTFLEALDSEASPLAAAVRILNAPRSAADADAGGLGMALARSEGYTLIEHGGLTSGYHSHVAYVPEWKRGVVVLANAFVAPVADLGLHLLDARCALHWQRPEVGVDSSILDRLVGGYRMQPTLVLTVTREADRLYVQATGKPRQRIFPTTEMHYFCKTIPAEIIFEADAEGQVKRLILHQSGLYRIAERMK
ncbi:serine hydrolase [Phyllobacterium zundukense]|uniref:Serine hydrolase n=1 Tax=Phyllobacterium zundukense TaxID=1867719 RepID=A0ACD4CYT2_9HYPH|nr:serine hydrolase [Phyllobacterium zundukense]UXN58751.1 serine hydrolase [Phyllobacterium zundukense]